MNEAESDELRRQVARIREERGCGVLVVEHDLRLIMQLCERIHVLNEGRTISEGTPASVRDDRDVIAAYIGEEKDDQQKGVEA
jgi:ABC-type branched-subunit amino acid transport system ATPase component